MYMRYKLHIWLPRLLAAALLLAAYGALLKAGDGIAVAARSENAQPPQGLIQTKNLVVLVRDGGVMMIPLFGCSLALVAFVFERAISLRRGRVIPGPFVKRFLHQL